MKSMEKNNQKVDMGHGQKGMTVIELVVSLTVFFIILSVSATIFVSILNQQRKILAEQELLNQTNYVMDYTSRLLREAVKDEDGMCIVDGGYYELSHLNGTTNIHEGIKFLGQDDVCYEFFLDSGVIKERKNGSLAQAILSDKFTVSYFNFVINGDKTIDVATESDLIQPRISMALKVEFDVNGQQ